MLAVLGTAVQENYHPLWGFNEKEMDGAIFHFQEIQNVYPLFWTALLFIIGVIEAKTIATGWDENMGGSVSTFPPSLPSFFPRSSLLFEPLGACLPPFLPSHSNTHPSLPSFLVSLPSHQTAIAGVKEDYICGNLGLDPLKIIENEDEEAFLSYRNKVRPPSHLPSLPLCASTLSGSLSHPSLPPSLLLQELNNGRLAMIAAAGITVQVCPSLPPSFSPSLAFRNRPSVSLTPTLVPGFPLPLTLYRRSSSPTASPSSSSTDSPSLMSTTSSSKPRLGTTPGRKGWRERRREGLLVWTLKRQRFLSGTCEREGRKEG